MADKLLLNEINRQIELLEYQPMFLRRIEGKDGRFPGKLHFNILVPFPHLLKGELKAGFSTGFLIRFTDVEEKYTETLSFKTWKKKIEHCKLSLRQYVDSVKDEICWVSGHDKLRKKKMAVNVFMKRKGLKYSPEWFTYGRALGR